MEWRYGNAPIWGSVDTIGFIYLFIYLIFKPAQKSTQAIAWVACWTPPAMLNRLLCLVRYPYINWLRVIKGCDMKSAHMV